MIVKEKSKDKKGRICMGVANENFEKKYRPNVLMLRPYI